MPHVVTEPIPPFTAAGGRLVVHGVPVATDNVAWIAVCASTGDAAIVDGPEAGPILDYADQHGIRLVAVLNTHTHGDHVGVNRDLERRGLLASMRVWGPAAAAADVPGLTDPVDEGDEVRIGDVVGRVLRTDGHLFGHVSFVFDAGSGDGDGSGGDGGQAGDGVLFCGDTLFAGGCGYLFQKDPPAMFRSLMRLAALPPGTRVCCAHEYTEDNLRFAWSVEPDDEALGERVRSTLQTRAAGRCTLPSTIGFERATNPFLRPGSPTIRERVGAPPDTTFEDVFARTRALKDTKAYKSESWPPAPLG